MLRQAKSYELGTWKRCTTLSLLLEDSNWQHNSTQSKDPIIKELAKASNLVPCNKETKRNLELTIFIKDIVNNWKTNEVTKWKKNENVTHLKPSQDW